MIGYAALAAAALFVAACGLVHALAELASWRAVGSPSFSQALRTFVLSAACLVVGCASLWSFYYG